MAMYADSMAQAPMLMIGLGHFGRRLLWVVEHAQATAGGLEACVLCPPQPDGNFDTATLPPGGASAALVIADCQETNSAVRLHETARVLATHGIKAYALLAAPANGDTGTRWAGEFAGGALLFYSSNDEWRWVRAQMPDMIRAWLAPGGQGLPDWQRLLSQVGGDLTAPAACLCAHAA